MKKVLIALDYDPTAEKVAEEGFALASAMKAEVILLHVVADSQYYVHAGYTSIMGFGGYNGAGMVPLETVKQLTQASQDYLDKIKLHLGGTGIETEVRDGDVAEAILATAKHTHAGIIVLGSHSRRWLEKIIMGSSTEKVLHHTTLPLFIIPTKQH